MIVQGKSTDIHGPIVPQCEPCTRHCEREPYAWRICPAYLNPEGKWAGGVCNHADIPKPQESEAMRRAKKAITQKVSVKKSKGSLHLRKYKHAREHSKKRYIEHSEVHTKKK